jgi:hypothetical protein
LILAEPRQPLLRFLCDRILRQELLLGYVNTAHDKCTMPRQAVIEDIEGKKQSYFAVVD